MTDIVGIDGVHVGITIPGFRPILNPENPGTIVHLVSGFLGLSYGLIQQNSLLFDQIKKIIISLALAIIVLTIEYFVYSY